MKLIWSNKSLSDLTRISEFLHAKNRKAGSDRVKQIRQHARQLLTSPRKGALVENISNIEVRRIFVGDYELRYQISLSHIEVLHIWHTREDR